MLTDVYARVPVIEMKYLSKKEFIEFIGTKEKECCKTCKHWSYVAKIEYGRCTLAESEQLYPLENHRCGYFEWNLEKLKKLAEDGCYL